MNESLLDYIDKAIRLELDMAQLYSIFAEYLEEDKVFWYRMEQEEKNHAALLKTGRDFVRFNKFPIRLLPEQEAALNESINLVSRYMDEFIDKPGREWAFTSAVELEKSAGEAHYQNFMDSDADDNLTRIFQDLNRADKDHAQRILKYWQDTVLKG